MTVAQLGALGVGRRGAAARAGAGKLHRVHQGVYAVGHRLLSREGRWMAAVLACGKGAFLSHRSAGALWEIAPSERTRIDVCSPTRAGRRHRGVDVHVCGWVDGGDLTEKDGIRCGGVPLTLLQLAAVVDTRRLERAVERADVLKLFDLRALVELLERAGRRQGTGRLRRVLALSADEAPVSHSELERRFLALCRRYGLPLPSFRAWVPVAGGGFEVDFLWRQHRLVVETDSRRFHLTVRAFETDRRRDQRLVAAGYRVLRFTWRQIESDPAEVVSVLRPLLCG